MERIRLFMWGYQRHFQHSVERAAERLFKALDPNMEVDVFLLGLVREDVPAKPGNHPVCLEPEECGFQPEAFDSVRKDTNHFMAISPDRNVMAMAESHQRSIEARSLADAQRKAVMSGIAGRRPHARNEFFFSGFMPVADYDVGVVLRLTHRHGISYYELPSVHADERFRVPASLLEGAMGIFLGACRASLYVPKPELVDEWDGPETDEILRKAGSRLMEAPVFAGGGVQGLYMLFDSCNYIASLTYESAASFGEMLIAQSGHENIQPTLTLVKPIALNEHRAIRKLLEISRSGDAILTDGDAVTGFGRLCGTYDQSGADLLKVRFTGHHKWELLHAEHKLMRVAYGNPALPLPPLNEASFIEDAERLFKGVSKDSMKKLFKLSEVACQQRHGTVLVITPEAAAEAKRLASQATGIVPVQVTAELLGSVTAIDGAVMIDTDGICHAIGVILDGEAVDVGNPARGARYNSSLRYWKQMEKRGKACLVVVVSEDGTAEWIPELMPRVSRRELKAKETEAEAILGLAEHPYSRAAGVVIWLDRHRFYLSASLCEKANLLEERNRKILKEERAIYFERKRFEPNPNLSDDYLKD
ncbi:MAG TPA: diadenylate cyclase [Terriglobia bacterium]|nr:diadenylate cyclase [Terriglobia bacterium]